MKIKWCGVIFTFFNLAIVSFSSLQPLKAKTRFSLEYFEQTRQLRTQNLQRAKVNYIQTKKVTEGLHSYIDADLVSTNANVKQHVSFEEVRDFYLDLKSFYLQKEFNSSTIKNKTDLGFQELDSYSFVTRALNGPGLATQFTITNFAFFSTGYFLLPSYEQFYVKS
ncbi:MAG: hypothetical protein KDD40_10255, partial [Bdellovibrionales bacterium]|nr:hypothetical protein [Bdellovibrionales bacterium]